MWQNWKSKLTNRTIKVERKSFLLSILFAYKGFISSYRWQALRCVAERDLLFLTFTSAFILFLANIPVQVAMLSEDLNLQVHLGLIGFVSIFFIPLLLYFISFLLFLTLKIFRGNASFFELRLATLWSLNVAGPLIILNGLLRGFFSNFVGIEYVALLLQCCIAWIIASMIAEAERFKSVFPLFSTAVVIIVLPRYIF